MRPGEWACAFGGWAFLATLVWTFGWEKVLLAPVVLVLGQL